MVYAAYTEKSITSKRQKVYTCLVVVPTLDDTFSHANRKRTER
ncbi:hypothetical protein C2W58_01703 [Bacillus pumilus]|nr:hypothetical protein C2W58_01703 [Bacillus pumilus]